MAVALKTMNSSSIREALLFCSKDTSCMQCSELGKSFTSSRNADRLNTAIMIPCCTAEHLALMRYSGSHLCQGMNVSSKGHSRVIWYRNSGFSLFPAGTAFKSDLHLFVLQYCEDEAELRWLTQWFLVRSLCDRLRMRVLLVLYRCNIESDGWNRLLGVPIFAYRQIME